MTVKSVRLVERNLTGFRRMPLIVVSGIFEPLFYLALASVGFEKLVGDVVGPGGRVMSYTSFAAPAFLAAAAMQGAIYEITNMFFKRRYAKTYDAVLNTPLGVGDIVTGEIAWALMRSALYTVAFLVVMAVMGLLRSWWAVLMLPATLLVGAAFAGLGAAATSFMRSWKDFELVQLFVLVFFLFSGTFYPLSTYPSWLRGIVAASPLYQSVHLLRSLQVGDVGLGLVGAVVYLALLAWIGVRGASARLTRVLTI
jgi:lipooligosaccharide transport system permease protein